MWLGFEPSRTEKVDLMAENEAPFLSHSVASAVMLKHPSLPGTACLIKGLGTDCVRYQSDSSSLTMKDLNADHLSRYVVSSLRYIKSNQAASHSLIQCLPPQGIRGLLCCEPQLLMVTALGAVQVQLPHEGCLAFPGQLTDLAELDGTLPVDRDGSSGRSCTLLLPCLELNQRDWALCH